MAVIITGIGGQDGYYLTELLKKNNIEVIGIIRHGGEFPTDPVYKNSTIVREQPGDPDFWLRIIDKFDAMVIFNLAAKAIGSKMFDDPFGMLTVNTFNLIGILEALRARPGVRLIQASSREIFSGSTESPQRESTQRAPRSVYGVSKVAADQLVDVYRRKYGIFASSAILFNHESPRRSPDFISRKISLGVARIALGLANSLEVGSLSSRRDWGFAGDYVKALFLMAERKISEDLVIATGNSHSVAEMCHEAFSSVGLNFESFVTRSPNFSRETEQVQVCGDSSRARALLDWAPTVDFSGLMKMMVRHDMEALKRSSGAG